MRRRSFLAGVGAALAAPGLVRAEGASTLRFIPQADLVVLDPMWTTAYVTRNHGFMVFDTLFGQDAQYRASPQMLEGAATADDGKRWTLTLRDGLRFHDGEPVRARDCVASIKRWGRRDAFGGALLAATDEVSAADDRTIVFRLKRPFPLLPEALAKTPGYNPVMMPERLAATDPFTAVTEMVGSGPYRFVADERVPGARAVYARFEGYLPRTGGTADGTAGPKVAHFDRVVWTTIPDPTTAAQALMNGEQDWWDYASVDLMPALIKARGVKVVVQEPSGQLSLLRMNHLQPPFDNPKIRQALVGAINQEDVVTAVVGTDPAMWHTGAGFFLPRHADGERRGHGGADEPAGPGAGEGADQGGRVWRGEGRADGGNRLPGAEGDGRCGGGYDGPGGLERGLCGDRLGVRGDAAGEEGPGFGWRLERVLHCVCGDGPVEPGRPPGAADQWRAGLVRLADGHEDRAVA